MPGLRFLLPSAITIALTKTNERQETVPGWEEFCLDPKFVSPAQTRAGVVLSSERERMERPHHLQTSGSSNSSKLMGIIIVVGIHVLAIIALVTALASGQIMKQIQDIKASVEAEKTPPKAPPPPPPDLAKPPPPVAIVPGFSGQTEAPPPIAPVKQQQAGPPPRRPRPFRRRPRRPNSSLSRARTPRRLIRPSPSVLASRAPRNCRSLFRPRVRSPIAKSSSHPVQSVSTMPHANM